ncbi:hypothetical protein COLO4_35493 [Corchorus olitorius]|uniref:Uncharacterized protein n=1 Tax=Corchorus olitorius TaxID=93759 RepID=A0A1R3GGK8_9ROSI|nr:hypothetical protein COLO4_35493 [Corchorus olitorius]
MEESFAEKILLHNNPSKHRPPLFPPISVGTTSRSKVESAITKKTTHHKT